MSNFTRQRIPDRKIVLTSWLTHWTADAIAEVWLLVVAKRGTVQFFQVNAWADASLLASRLCTLTLMRVLKVPCVYLLLKPRATGMDNMSMHSNPSAWIWSDKNLPRNATSCSFSIRSRQIHQSDYFVPIMHCVWGTLLRQKIDMGLLTHTLMFAHTKVRRAMTNLPKYWLEERRSPSFSPDVILCGWLGLKHQLTN